MKTQETGTLTTSEALQETFLLWNQAPPKQKNVHTARAGALIVQWIKGTSTHFNLGRVPWSLPEIGSEELGELVNKFQWAIIWQAFEGDFGEWKPEHDPDSECITLGVNLILTILHSQGGKFSFEDHTHFQMDGGDFSFSGAFLERLYQEIKENYSELGILHPSETIYLKETSPLLIRIRGIMALEELQGSWGEKGRQKAIVEAIMASQETDFGNPTWKDLDIRVIIRTSFQAGFEELFCSWKKASSDKELLEATFQTCELFAKWALFEPIGLDEIFSSSLKESPEEERQRNSFAQEAEACLLHSFSDIEYEEGNKYTHKPLIK